MNDLSTATFATIAPHQSRRWLRGPLLVGLICSVAIGLSAMLSPAQFFRAYLAAYLWCLNIALGCMAIAMIYHITGGAWGFIIRRILEAGIRTLPLLAVGFIPIALGAHVLYPWAQPAAVKSSDLLTQQSVYMNFPFWCLRAAVYFGLWLAIAFFLCRFSRKQDRSGDPRIRPWLNTLSGIGLVIYGASMHFASVDWVISLQSEYHSTISGPLLASQQLLAALAFAVLLLMLLAGNQPLSEFHSAKSLNDLGSLLLTFVVLWSYMWWFEWMLTWIANLPADLVWYVDRIRGGWWWTSVLLAVFGFVVPFLLLLQRVVKRRPKALAAIAGLLLLSQLAFTHWSILPAFRPQNFGECWISFLAPPALGGICLAWFVWQLRRFPLLPMHDVNVLTARRLRLTDEWELAWEESLSHG